MAGKKRRCGTCRYFEKNQERDVNGWCTHPARQLTTDAKIYVRTNELACRNSWGDDLWVDMTGSEVMPPVSRQPSLPTPAVAIPVYDDEVTSVTVSGMDSGSPSGEDDVIETNVRHVRDPWEDSEQDERQNLLYRNVSSAILRARERHQSRTRPAPNAQDPDDAPNNPTPNDESADSETSTSSNENRFPPDDIVEEEVPAEPTNIDDDRIIDASGVTPRSRRLRKLSEDLPRPKGVTAGMNEMPIQDMSLPVSSEPERDRWNSIPARAEDIQLPFRERPAHNPHSLAAEAAFDDVDQESRFDRVMRRAHDIRSKTRVEENRNIRQAESPILERTTYTATPSDSSVSRTRMPDLPDEAPNAVPRRSTMSLATGQALGARTFARQSAPPQPTGRESTASSISDHPRDHLFRGPHTRAQGSPPSPTIDVSDPAGMETLRNRLFNDADTPDETSQTESHAEAMSSQPASVTREPISVARRIELVPAADNDAAIRAHQHLRRQERNRLPAQQKRPIIPVLQDIDDRQPSQAEDAFDIRDFIIDESLPLLDMTITIAPGVKQECRTCRNYHPSEQAGRGWCTNAFAFTHRQMVNSASTPCASTMGSWWLPADREVWLEDIDTTMPDTPRMDRMLARKRRHREEGDEHTGT